MKCLWTTCFLVVGASAAVAAAPDYSGRWEIAVREFGQNNYYLPMTDGRLVIAMADGHATGSFGRLGFSGTLEKDGLHLACSTGGKPCGDLVLRLGKDGLSGGGFLLGADTVNRFPVTVTGHRPIAKPAAAAMHDFDPREFHPFYSPDLPPVLHIFPGDSVKTRTADSRGQDADGQPRAPRGNPQTGPFYVEGAMPGDTLVVHLDRVRTNRDTAYQGNSISTNALLPGYLQSLPKPDSGPGGFATWKIDAASGTATLAAPGERLGNYKIKLQPMLGCIGVAPPRGETLGSGHLGVFGGNMDFREMREGVTLYLPVFRPGALLYLGDGHAEQGDGELPGQGLETSLDVQFTVSVMEDKSLGQPWVEDDTYAMVMGVGTSMDDALKQATTGMSRWLADTYHLTPQDIAAVLGTAMQYQIAEVVDSEYDIVAKVRKDALSQIKK
ncbi:MAG TPA: acetamidase/formamidase family protein [Rhizomicrobium sp.]|nr:acetamidase/formamidase family protein [Rhizomicrobium sp.]